jgi:hypothetical protein
MMPEFSTPLREMVKGGHVLEAVHTTSSSNLIGQKLVLGPLPAEERLRNAFVILGKENSHELNQC